MFKKLINKQVGFFKGHPKKYFFIIGTFFILAILIFVKNSSLFKSNLDFSEPKTIESSQPQVVENHANLDSGDIASTSSIPQLTTSPSPSVYQAPPPSPSPSPSPTNDIDLVNEGLGFVPEKLSQNKFFLVKQAYAIDPVEAQLFEQIHSGFYHGPFKQDNKIKSIIARIRNNGHEDAKNVELKFIVDGETLHEFNVDIIEKQSLKIVREDVGFPSDVGKHRVEFQIDPEKKLLESRYDNNTKIIEYEVIP